MYSSVEVKRKEKGVLYYLLIYLFIHSFHVDFLMVADMDEVNIGTQINRSDSQRPHEGMLERRAWGGDLRKKKEKEKKRKHYQIIIVK